MDPQQLTLLLAFVEWAAELGLCSLALGRRVWRILPCFVAYLIALVVVDAARWDVFLIAGMKSRAYRLTYWLSQPVLILARAAVLANICRAALRHYSGIWRLAKPLLMVTAALLMAFAAIRSNASNRMVSYLIFAERELEFAIVLALLALLMLSRYYGVALDRPLSGIALGMGLYSSYVIVNYSVILQQFQVPWWVFSAGNTVAYTVALIIWIYTLWAPLPEPVQPELSTPESYERNTLAVTGQMKEVNDRLEQLMKR